MSFIDGSVVNVALPAMQRDFGSPLATMQWIVNGYMLMLAALILLGGAAGDRLGRRRVFLIGLAAFAGASLACGLAPTVQWLIAARFTIVGVLRRTTGVDSTQEPFSREWIVGAAVAAAVLALLVVIVATTSWPVRATVNAGAGFGSTLANTYVVGLAVLVARVAQRPDLVGAVAQDQRDATRRGRGR